MIDFLSFLLRLLNLTQVLHSSILLIEIVAMSQNTFTLVFDMYNSCILAQELKTVHFIMFCLRGTVQTTHSRYIAMAVFRIH